MIEVKGRKWIKATIGVNQNMSMIVIHTDETIATALILEITGKMSVIICTITDMIMGTAAEIILETDMKVVITLLETMADGLANIVILMAETVAMILANVFVEDHPIENTKINGMIRQMKKHYQATYKYLLKEFQSTRYQLKREI